MQCTSFPPPISNPLYSLQDPKLYAANVKKAMIEASGLINSNEAYEDKLAWELTTGYFNKEVVRKRAMTKKKEAEAEAEGGVVMNQV